MLSVVTLRISLNNKIIRFQFASYAYSAVMHWGTKKQVRPNAFFFFDARGGDPAVQGGGGGGGYPAVWGIFLWEARVCSFSLGEPARLTRQKTSTPKRKSVFICFLASLLIYFLLLS